MSESSNIICLPPNDNEKRFLLGKKGKASLLAIALNPSTANEVSLDPTSRSIQTLAHDNACDSWYLVNLYPLRTPHPSKLPKAANTKLAKENMDFIEQIIKDPSYAITKVLFCWGNEVDRLKYLKSYASKVSTMIQDLGVPSYYMHLTASGNPYHPSPTPVNRFLGGIKNVTLKPYPCKAAR